MTFEVGDIVRCVSRAPAGAPPDSPNLELYKFYRVIETCVGYVRVEPVETCGHCPGWSSNDRFQLVQYKVGDEVQCIKGYARPDSFDNVLKGDKCVVIEINGTREFGVRVLAPSRAVVRNIPTNHFMPATPEKDKTVTTTTLLTSGFPPVRLTYKEALALLDVRDDEVLGVIAPAESLGATSGVAIEGTWTDLGDRLRVVYQGRHRFYDIQVMKKAAPQTQAWPRKISRDRGVQLVAWLNGSGQTAIGAVVLRDDRMNGVSQVFDAGSPIGEEGQWFETETEVHVIAKRNTGDWKVTIPKHGAKSTPAAPAAAVHAHAPGSEWNTKCPRCGAPGFIGLGLDGVTCSGACKPMREVRHYATTVTEEVDAIMATKVTVIDATTILKCQLCVKGVAHPSDVHRLVDDAQEKMFAARLGWSHRDPQTASPLSAFLSRPCPTAELALEIVRQRVEAVIRIERGETP